jgi:hypothetical protein
MRCAVDAVCAECREPLTLTFHWDGDVAPGGTERILGRLFMCPRCRNPFICLIPQGAGPGSAHVPGSDSIGAAVSVPFFNMPPVVSPAGATGADRRRAFAGAALPAMQRLQYWIWLTWPALYALAFGR